VREISPVAASNVRINGGFFAMRGAIFDYIRPGEELVREPFERLIAGGGLLAYEHAGFWQCMDTFKDKQRLEQLDRNGAPWKLWERGAS
jgi:glucose-1-phosphate cytidylyltransferase